MDENLGMSDMAVLEQTLSAAPDAAVVADVVDDAPDVNASIDAAIASEKAKPAELAPDVPAETAVDPAKPVEATKPVEAASDVDLTTDDLTVKGLNERLAKSPEFKALVDKDPELKKQLFYAARRNERATIYDEMFQTPAMAKEVHSAANEFFEFKDSYSENPEEALKQLFVMTIEKDDKGEMVRGSDGRFVTSGAFDKAMALHRSAFYGQLDQLAQGLGDNAFGNTDITQADLSEAIRIFQVMESEFGFGKAPAPRAAAVPPAPVDSTLPADVQAKLDRLDKLEKGAQDSQKQTFDTFRTSVTTEVTKALETDVKTRLAAVLPTNSAMTDYTKNAIVRDVIQEVEKLAKANAAHKSIFERSLKSAPRDGDGIKKMVDLERSYAKEIFPRILSRLLTQNTQSVVAQNGTMRGKLDGQMSRKELETSGGGGAPARPDAKEKARELDAAARKAGKRMTDMDIVNMLTP